VTTRRRFVTRAAACATGVSSLSACSNGFNALDAARALRRINPPAGTSASGEAVATRQALVRYATLAPSSHNTQCWRFHIAKRSIAITPDFARRCPAVDPDDHHLFVSLGCATENLVHAALAMGFHADARFDTATEAAWHPTALLPSQGVRSGAVEARSANATLVDGTITLSLLLRFDESALITSVHADARGAGVGKHMVMLPWDGSVSDYPLRDGLMVPTVGEAAWMRPEGRRPYFIGSLTPLVYEFSP
jgi:hypothetical protein